MASFQGLVIGPCGLTGSGCVRIMSVGAGWNLFDFIRVLHAVPDHLLAGCCFLHATKELNPFALVRAVLLDPVQTFVNFVPRISAKTDHPFTGIPSVEIPFVRALVLSTSGVRSGQNDEDQEELSHP